MTKKHPKIDKARELYQCKDDEHWDELQKIVQENNISFSEMLINYPAFIRRRELTRVLADYDLFKMIMHMPGSIAEFGVYLGSGTFTWAKLLETFVPGDRSRKVYGFESGSGYGEFAPEDGNPLPWVEKVVGIKVVPDGYLERMVELTNLDNLIPRAERCRVIQGNIMETVPEFARNNHGTRFSLLYFDVCLYEPTLTGLREFYPLLMPGGIVAFNAYGSPPWQGEAVAFEQYFKEIRQPQPRLQKFTYSIHPSGYFIKE